MCKKAKMNLKIFAPPDMKWSDLNLQSVDPQTVILHMRLSVTLCSGKNM